MPLTLDAEPSSHAALVAADEIERLRASNAELLIALTQAALELEEAANLLRGTGLSGCACLMQEAAKAHRDAVKRAAQ